MTKRKLSFEDEVGGEKSKGYNDENGGTQEFNLPVSIKSILAKEKHKRGKDMPSRSVIATDRFKHTEPLLGDTRDSKLDQALQKFHKDNRLSKREQNSEQKLVGTLERELTDIIALFQNERAAQTETISKLTKEIERLNKTLLKQKKSSSRSSRIMDNTELQTQRLQKESSDFKKQIIKLQEVIKERDKQMEEMKGLLRDRKSLCDEQKNSELKTEVYHLRSLLEESKKELQKKHSSTSSQELTEIRVKLEASQKYAQGEIKRLFGELKEKDKEIVALKQRLNLEPNASSMREYSASTAPFQQRCTCTESAVCKSLFDDLIGKVQKLEEFILKSQKRYHKKARHYFDRVKSIEQEIKTQRNGNDSYRKLTNDLKELKTHISDIEHKYSFQAICNKSLQDSNYY